MQVLFISETFLQDIPIELTKSTYRNGHSLSHYFWRFIKRSQHLWHTPCLKWVVKQFEFCLVRNILKQIVKSKPQGSGGQLYGLLTLHPHMDESDNHKGAFHLSRTVQQQLDLAQHQNQKETSHRP